MTVSSANVELFLISSGSSFSIERQVLMVGICTIRSSLLSMPEKTMDDGSCRKIKDPGASSAAIAAMQWSAPSGASSG